ncbi:MAG: glycerol acyltransferase, partial [Bacteroidales bacterium]|nr:glycerol acyltransferase [Bacteroidales bacterium]
ANVPIVVGYLDFKKKELGVKGIIEDISDDKKVMRQINEYYKDVTAKHPDQFVLDTRDCFDK